MSAPELICLGEPMQELNRQPPDGAGRDLYLRGHGGDTSNAAIAAARQGARVGYASAIGQDGPGESFLELWAREGVDASRVIRRSGAPTALYLVEHDERGHRFAFYRRGSAASLLSPEEISEETLRGARALHLSGISQGISASACDAGFRAMELARGLGLLVSYDTNLRPALWPLPRARAVIHAAVAMADLALPSLEDAEALTGLSGPDAVADFYLRLCPLVVLKLGPEGCLVATREGRSRVPGRTVESVDATGAGDAFGGAFLARFLAGDPPEKAARYANAAAALSTTGYGAVAPIPREAEVQTFLAEDA